MSKFGKMHPFGGISLLGINDVLTSVWVSFIPVVGRH